MISESHFLACYNESSVACELNDKSVSALWMLSFPLISVTGCDRDEAVNKHAPCIIRIEAGIFTHLC